MTCHTSSRIARAALAICVLAATAATPLATAVSEDGWRPFAEPEARRPSRTPPPADTGRGPPLAPMDGISRAPWRPAQPLPAPGPSLGTDDAIWRAGAGPRDPRHAPPLVERPSAVERSELPPVEGAERAPGPPSARQGRQPAEMWRGLDPVTFERLIGALVLPPRSPALAALWHRVLASDPGLAVTEEAGLRALALRAEAMRRTGLVAEEAELLERVAHDTALVAVLKARARIAQGDGESGCQLARAAVPRRADLPGPLRHELILIAGYCGAADGNPAAAGLAADMARYEGLDSGPGLALLDVIASGTKALPPLSKQVSTTEYALIRLSGAPVQAHQIVERASPALLAMLARDTEQPPRQRLAAAELAARLNILEPADLASVWRAEPFQPQDMAEPLGARVEASARRALLFRAAEAERTPMRRTRLIRALLDDARRAGLYLPAMVAVAPLVTALRPAEELSWFAETAVEVHLSAGDYERARAWIALSARSAAPGSGLEHWMALADIADAAMTGPRGTSLPTVETLALRGRFAADLLHRLATVLDALDYHVPIPLWEAASRTPQPASGHLPATGVLSELQDAARKAEIGRTALLAMQTLGADGGEGAHIIALGDAIRALKRARLETDARRLAFEALFAGWPRAATN